MDDHEAVAARPDHPHDAIPRHDTSAGRAHVPSRLARLESPARLPGIDAARGLAVVGMFAAHLTVTPPIEWDTPTTWTGIVDGRSSILFATLAGASLALSTGAAVPLDGARLRTARRLLMGRALVLWVLGLLLVALAVPVYVILPAYALLFVVGAGLLHLRPAQLFVIAATLAVASPFVITAINTAGWGPAGGGLSVLVGWHYPFLLWTAFLAAGMGAGRLLAASPTRAVALVAAGTASAVIGYAVIGPIGNDAVAARRQNQGDGENGWLVPVLQDAPHSSGVGEALGSGGFALAVLGLCVLVGLTPLRWALWPLRAVGSMPLTAYTAHLVVWATWIAAQRAEGLPVDPLAGFRALEPFWPMTTGVMVCCAIWATLVGRGPLETAVAMVTARLSTMPSAPVRE